MKLKHGLFGKLLSLLVVLTLLGGMLPQPAQAFFLRGGAPSGAVAYLPAVSVSPLAVYSSNLLVGSYSGPLFRLVRIADSATMDIYASPDGSPNVSGVAAWLGSATYAQVDTWYDQMGSGLNATQIVANNRPWFSLTNTIRGKYSITYGKPSSWFNLPSGLTGSGRSFTTVNVAAYSTSNQGSLGFEGATFNTAGSLSVIPGNSATARLQVLTSSAFVPGNSYRSRSQPQVVIAAAGASNTVLYQDDAVYTLAANNAGTWAGGQIGYINSGYAFAGEYYAHIVYPAQLSSSDASVLQTYLNQRFDVLTTSDTQIVWAGHSAVEGTGATLLQNNQRQAEPNLSKRVFISNQGVFGQLAATIYNARAMYAAQYRPELATNIIVGPDIANDLNSTASGSIVGKGTDYYNNYVLPFVQAMQTAGYQKVLIQTMLPLAYNGSTTDQSQKETERLAYNTLVRNNASTYGYLVLDYAAIPQMADINSAYYASDHIHPSSLGYGLMAGVFVSVVNPLLAANDNPSPNMFAANDNFQWRWRAVQ